MKIASNSTPIPPLDILVVDDNPDDAFWLQCQLEREGEIKVTVAESLMETLQMIAKQRFGIIILDLGLPDSEGLETLKKVQEQDTQTPIIAVTGLQQNEGIGNDAVKQGAQEFLVKGDITTHGLLQAIMHAIERKKAQNDVEAISSEWKALLQRLPTPLIGLDEECAVCFLNEAAQATWELSWEPSCVLSFQVFAERLGIKSAEILGILSACQKEGVAKRLTGMKVRGKNNEKAVIDISIIQTGAALPGIPVLLILANDITHVHNIEAQLGLAQKMESIGQLAAGVAHEINTPMQYMTDNLRFFQENFCLLEGVVEAIQTISTLAHSKKLAPTHWEILHDAIQNADLEYLMTEIPRALQQSLEGAERVSKIVRAMKEFSHPGIEEKKPIDLNHALETTITVARNEWKYVADIELELDSTLPLVPCFPGELNQVFLNLLVNAAQAIGEIVDRGKDEKGRILVSTRQQGGVVEIRVGDTGPGIPEEIQQRIFEPFFTTKEVGKGTGQGLAIAHDTIVKKHDGQLFLESTVGKGATFIMQLPLKNRKMSPVA